MGFELPDLPEGWTYSSLESCCKKGSITYGIVQPGKPTVDGVPTLRVNNFRETHLDLSEVMCVSDEIEARYSRTRLKGGEVLLTIVGSVGQVAVAPAETAGFNVARAIAVLDPVESLDAEWVALCLRSPLSQHLLGSRANTTVQTTINLKDLRALPIPVPPASERHAIARMVGSIDKRIGLLRETNTTLETIAQALFKSWFVDFDPVRAKMEGRAPEGMDEATAALFPDALKESGVPIGWTRGRVGDLMKLHKGSINPATRADEVFQHFSLPAFDDGAMPVLELGSAIKSNKTSVPTDAILVSKLNPRFPRIWIPSDVRDNAICSTEFLPMIPTELSTQAFNYCLASSPAFTEKLEQLVTGTSSSHQRVKPDSMLVLESVIPPLNVVIAFDEVALPILDAVKNNRYRIQVLADLRDTLLPRLISGKLRLPQRSRFVPELIA